MKRFLAVLLAVLMLSLPLAGCGESPAPETPEPPAVTEPETPEPPKEPEEPEPPETPKPRPPQAPFIGEGAAYQTGDEEEAAHMFRRAAEWFTQLFTDDPGSYKQEILKAMGRENDEGEPSDLIEIENAPQHRYFKVSQFTGEELWDLYGELFTGEALEWVATRKFITIDNVVYCPIGGGMTGFGVDNVKAEKIGEEGDTIHYEIHFQEAYGCDPEDRAYFDKTSAMDLQKTEDGYRISRIDYMQDRLGDEAEYERFNPS